MYFIIILFIIFIFILIKKNKSKYTAIIIEPRKHKALQYVVNNILENLNNDWNVIIYHGTNNYDFVINIINNKLIKYKNRITLKNLKVDNLTIPNYNKLFYTRSFYDTIPTEIFLVFQTDSCICSKNKNLINEFIEYDYVGAPWKHLNNDVGNGGFSLRRKSKMIELIDKCLKYDTTYDLNEDLFFSYGCDNIKINKPSFEKAKKFSVESIFIPNSFGFHKSWNISPSQYELYKNNCQEVEDVRKLNL